MKYVCEIEANDYQTKFELMAQAGRDESMWKPVISVDLDRKCGSCEYFVPKPLFNSLCYGNCLKGYAGYRKRSCPACKAYERKME